MAMNNSKFFRSDYAQVGTTPRNCLRILRGGEARPAGVSRFSRKGKKKIEGDKFVVAGLNGVLLCADRINGDTNIVFKTNPAQSITALALGGALNTVQDKTFIATGSVIKGYSKKGKQFLSFESNLTDPIEIMYVYGVDLFLCGRTVFYHFHDCVERSSFVGSEKINSILCLPVTEGGWVGHGLMPVIACDDKTLKVIENGKMLYEVFLNDVPLTIQLYMNDGGFSKRKVLYGTKGGKLGLVELANEGGTQEWEMNTQTSGGVTVIRCHNLTNTGASDIVVGKEDGMVEVYSVDENDTLVFRQSYQCEESITGLDCGRINSERADEIVVCTYTGWVFALTNEATPEQWEPASSPNMEIKVKQLRGELEELELKVREERERYDEITHGNPDAMSVLPTFAINDRFVLDRETACYLLSIELVIPIEFVVLQSESDLELMDTARSTAVVSFTKSSDTENSPTGNKLLATYRCQADTTRIEIRIRSLEGRGGILKAYIVPDILPKTCQVRTYPIKPLAMQERIHEIEFNRPINTLAVSGTFTASEAHEWLVSCVSQVPDRCPIESPVTFTFRSSEQNGTLFQANYRENQAMYKSDSISTVVIVRDVISRITTSRKIKVHMSLDINEETIVHTIQMVHPQLEYHANLVKNAKLAYGLRELESSFENPESYLEPEFLRILKQHDELAEQLRKQSSHFDRTLGVITDLYVDHFKLQGINPKNKTSELIDMCSTNYSLEQLYDFFKIKPP